MMTRDLFCDDSTRIALGDAAWLLPGFARAQADTVLNHLDALLATSPLRHMTTPGGRRLSVAMSNCGDRGWISDRHGYRYTDIDPLTGQAWPTLPHELRSLAQGAASLAGFARFQPDTCLISCYVPGERLGLHQDRDEYDLSAPIVSVSLGLPATFLWGGLKRNDSVQRIPLEPGDVVVWGGASRLRFHGVSTVHAGDVPARINLSFRQAA